MPLLGDSHKRTLPAGSGSRIACSREEFLKERWRVLKSEGEISKRKLFLLCLVEETKIPLPK